MDDRACALAREVAAVYLLSRHEALVDVLVRQVRVPVVPISVGVAAARAARAAR